MTIDIPYYLWFQLITSGITFIILIYQRIKHKIVPLNWMIILIGLAYLRAVVQTLYIVFPTTLNPGGRTYLLFNAFAILAFYFYAETILNEKVPLKRFSLVLIFLGGYIFSYLYHSLYGETYRFGMASQAFYEFSYDLFTLVCFTTTTYAFIRMSIFSPNNKSKKLAISMLIASIILLISSLIELSEYLTGILIDSGYITIPAFLVIMLVYIIEPTFAYSTPVTIFRLLIIHESGIPLIEKIFEQVLRKDSLLLAGVTSAIDNIMKELLKNPGSVKSINMTSRVLMIESVSNIFSIIEVNRPTQMLRTALISFSQKFTNTFSKELMKFKGNITKFEQNDTFLKQFFPFI